MTKNITLDDILDLCIEKNASDVHLWTDSKIALRIHGNLHFVEQSLTINQLQETVLWALNKTQKQVLNHKKQIHFTYPYKEKHSFRISVFYKKGNLSLAIHSIATEILSLSELGLPAGIFEILEGKTGIIFITGERNSGKSNTVRSILEHINLTQSKHIFTLEHPIEYYFETKKSLFSQCELYADVASYQVWLETSAFVDADIIVLDNAYNPESILALLNLAETGSLVIAQLPTFGASNTLENIINLFPQEKQSYIQNRLAINLLGILSQKLLPRADQDGQIPLFELMTINANITSLIRSGSFPQIQNAIQAGISQGMMTIDYYAKKLIENDYLDKDAYKKINIDD